MKFLSKMIITIIVISILITGCGKLEEVTEESGENTNERQNLMREKGAPDLYGRVKSIIGNEVVLEVIEIPTIEANQEENGENRERSINEVAMGGQMPGGMRGQRVGGNRELNLTGETKTLLIPVGVPITTFGQDNSRNLDIGDIYGGTLLQLWFDKNDEERIVQVRMIQGR